MLPRLPSGDWHRDALSDLTSRRAGALYIRRLQRAILVRSCYRVVTGWQWKMSRSGDGGPSTRIGGFQRKAMSLRILSRANYLPAGDSAASAIMHAGREKV